MVNKRINQIESAKMTNISKTVTLHVLLVDFDAFQLAQLRILQKRIFKHSFAAGFNLR